MLIYNGNKDVMNLMNKGEAMRKLAIVLFVAAFLFSPVTGFSEKSKKKEATIYPVAGKVERASFLLDKLFSTNAVVEKVAEGFTYASSCVDFMGNILVGDISTNLIFRWNEQKGLGIFQPLKVYSTNLSGLCGVSSMSLDTAGNLIIAHHGDRRIIRRLRDGHLVSLADYFNWMRFNGPAGIAVKSNGDLYFADPPYNVFDASIKPPQKEMMFNGIYRVTKNGFVDLLSSKVICPAAIAFTPDETGLYVLNCEPADPVVLRYSVKKDGTLENPEVFLTLTNVAEKIQPSGLTVDKKGNLFISSNIGVLIFSPTTRFLGAIRTDSPATSCAFDSAGKYLYITTRYNLCRIAVSGKK